MSLEEKFHAAVEVVNSIPYDGTFEPSDEMMLKFYAYQMQATEGPCNEGKPFIWNTVARNKWNAWNELGDMSSETAMQNYIEELTKVIETMSYNEKIARFIALMGSFYEIVSEECYSSNQRKNNKWPENMTPNAILESYESPTFSDLYNIPKRRLTGGYEMKDYKEGLSYESPGPLYQNALTVTHPESSIGDYPPSRSSLSSSSSSSSDFSNIDLLSDISDNESHLMTERGTLALFKNNKHCKASHFSTQEDLFILTFINLQNAMEEICEKFEKLNCLAEKQNEETNLRFQVVESETSSELNWTGTAFALLWPIIVEIALG